MVSRGKLRLFRGQFSRDKEPQIIGYFHNKSYTCRIGRWGDYSMRFYSRRKLKVRNGCNAAQSRPTNFPTSQTAPSHATATASNHRRLSDSLQPNVPSINRSHPSQRSAQQRFHRRSTRGRTVQRNTGDNEGRRLNEFGALIQHRMNFLFDQFFHLILPT